jgi:hypothetical protein
LPPYMAVSLYASPTYWGNKGHSNIFTGAFQEDWRVINLKISMI